MSFQVRLRVGTTRNGYRDLCMISSSEATHKKLIGRTSPMSTNPNHVYIHIRRLQGIHLEFKWDRIRQCVVQDTPFVEPLLVVSFSASTMVSS